MKFSVIYKVTYRLAVWVRCHEYEYKQKWFTFKICENEFENQAHTRGGRGVAPPGKSKSIIGLMCFGIFCPQAISPPIQYLVHLQAW